MPGFTGEQLLPFASQTTSDGSAATLPGFIPVTTHCQGGTSARLGAPFEQASDTNPASKSQALFML
jgi:hypothetical protein